MQTVAKGSSFPTPRAVTTHTPIQAELVRVCIHELLTRDLLCAFISA